jgi:hypothetical protein
MKKCEGTQILLCAFLPGGGVLSGEASSGFGASPSHHGSRGVSTTTSSSLPPSLMYRRPASSESRTLLPSASPMARAVSPASPAHVSLAKASCLQYGMTTSQETSARAMSSVLMKGKGLDGLFV